MKNTEKQKDTPEEETNEHDTKAEEIRRSSRVLQKTEKILEKILENERIKKGEKKKEEKNKKEHTAEENGSGNANTKDWDEPGTLKEQEHTADKGEEGCSRCFRCKESLEGFQIGCEKCEKWFHGRCVGVAKGDYGEDEDYECENCNYDSLEKNNKELESF